MVQRNRNILNGFNDYFSESSSSISSPLSSWSALDSSVSISPSFGALSLEISETKI
jgi:hypothetical protein